jgi:putative ubiquitin-RnfH superfamily antitoxin RatB of RatAB toxin-antitoxin module
MPEAGHITVEVVYALPDRHTVIAVSIPPDACVADAIAASGILGRHPEIGLTPIVAGIFGRRVTHATRPVAGDRIEIYRPLLADPKQSRRARVRRKK